MEEPPFILFIVGWVYSSMPWLEDKSIDVKNSDYMHVSVCFTVSVAGLHKKTQNISYKGLPSFLCLHFIIQDYE